MIKAAILVIGFMPNGHMHSGLGHHGSSLPSVTLMPSMEYCEKAKTAILKEFPYMERGWNAADKGIPAEAYKCLELE